MTKDEAIKSMRAGNKVTHKYFTDGEWITIKDGSYLFEDGYLCQPEVFWHYKLNAAWEDGWSAIEESPTVQHI